MLFRGWVGGFVRFNRKDLTQFGESLGGLGLILVQFRGVLGWVGIDFNAILGSPWVGWD